MIFEYSIVPPSFHLERNFKISINISNNNECNIQIKGTIMQKNLAISSPSYKNNMSKISQ